MQIYILRSIGFSFDKQVRSIWHLYDCPFNEKKIIQYFDPGTVAGLNFIGRKMRLNTV